MARRPPSGSVSLATEHKGNKQYKGRSLLFKGKVVQEMLQQSHGRRSQDRHIEPTQFFVILMAPC